MGKAAWPTEEEVSARVEGLGGEVPGGVSIQDEIDALIADFEQRTGFSPFLASGAVARRYNPPGERGDPHVLMLAGGIVTLSSLKVGISTSYTGSGLVLGTDYRLERLRAGGPYEIVRFRDEQYGNSESIEIVAIEGWDSTVPLDAWIAIREKAAMNVLRSGTSSPADVKREKAGPVEYEYSESSGQVGRVDSLYADAVTKYSKCPI